MGNNVVLSKSYCDERGLYLQMLTHDSQAFSAFVIGPVSKEFPIYSIIL